MTYFGYPFFNLLFILDGLGLLSSCTYSLFLLELYLKNLYIYQIVIISWAHFGSPFLDMVFVLDGLVLLSSCTCSLFLLELYFKNLYIYQIVIISWAHFGSPFLNLVFVLDKLWSPKFMYLFPVLIGLTLQKTCISLKNNHSLSLLWVFIFGLCLISSCVCSLFSLDLHVKIKFKVVQTINGAMYWLVIYHGECHAFCNFD